MFKKKTNSVDDAPWDFLPSPGAVSVLQDIPHILLFIFGIRKQQQFQKYNTQITLTIERKTNILNKIEYTIVS